jgi:ATP adenylyltransferase
MSDDRWNKSLSGVECPFCLPRVDENQFWSKIVSLSVSTLYLHKIQSYPGYALLVFDTRHANRPSDLTPPEWLAFCGDLHKAQHAIEKVVQPDHMNVAALGNQMSHLHWHIIPRYKTDDRWGGPIWMTTENEMAQVALPDDARRTMIDAIRKRLSST